MRYVTRQITFTRTYTNHETNTRSQAKVTADVQFEIDDEAIYQQLGEQAARNKTKRAGEYGGLLKAKALSINEGPKTPINW